MSTEIESFGNRLKRLRAQMGLSQRQAAGKLELNVNQLVRYELDRSKPSYEHILNLADFFEVTTDYLIHGNEKRFTDRARIKDPALLEMFRIIDNLNRIQRDQIKWALDGLLSKISPQSVKHKSRSLSSSREIARLA